MSKYGIGGRSYQVNLQIDTNRMLLLGSIALIQSEYTMHICHLHSWVIFNSQSDINSIFLQGENAKEFE